MTLQEILNDLALSEYRHVFTGQKDIGPGIDKCFIPGIVTYLNIALTELYTEFKLKTGEMVLRLDGRRVYILDKDFTESQGLGQDKYILDMEDPFNNDLLKVETVLTTDNRLVRLNKHNDRNSMFTPEYNKLVMPRNGDLLHKVDHLVLTYRAKHELLDPIQAAERPEFTYIDLPPAYKQALLLSMAARKTMPLTPAEGLHLGTTYKNLYMAELARLRDQNYENDWDFVEKDIHRDGWV